MKKICITFFAFLIIVLSAIGLTLPKSAPETEYLRIHIRAESNDERDQNVKYLVKAAVVDYLTPYIAECDTKKKAETLLTGRIPEIERVADEVLSSNGFRYTAKAEVRTEKFPTRSYGELTLESGYYEALIIELGSGKGDNWWCVVYPPLCFTGEGKGYVYKSKIYRIIKNFFDNGKEEK